MLKELKDISWLVDEPTYRADPALSYSTLAKYERNGFYSIKLLDEKISTLSLLLGSVTDYILTDGEDAFNDRFAVMDYNITDSGINVCKSLASLYGEQYKEFKDIPEVLVSQTAQEVGFWKGPKWNSRRYKEVLNTGDVDIYYKVLTSNDKTIISSQMYSDALAMVDALKTSKTTKFYFAPDNPFDDSIRRYYQLKFKATLGGVNYRCMADEIIVDYEHKTISPIDLKTSSHPEAEFYKSFIDWTYNQQARLYWKIIRENLDKDEYFRDFTLDDYTFIVVNKNTLTPLTWKYTDTQKRGTLIYGKNHNIELRDPLEVGKELHYYLTHDCKVPLDISMTEPNDIVKFLNTKM